MTKKTAKKSKPNFETITPPVKLSHKPGSKTLTGKKPTEINTSPRLKLVAGNGTLYESAVVVWARMNPITKGHDRCIKEAINYANENQASVIIALSSSKDTTKNPLTLEERQKILEFCYGETINIVENSYNSPITLLHDLSEQFTSVTLVAGEDRADDYQRILEDYNGKDFTFENTNVVKLARDEYSATNARTLALQEDFEAFKAVLPESAEVMAESIYELTRFGMNINNTDSFNREGVMNQFAKMRYKNDI